MNEHRIAFFIHGPAQHPSAQVLKLLDKCAIHHYDEKKLASAGLGLCQLIAGIKETNEASGCLGLN